MPNFVSELNPELFSQMFNNQNTSTQNCFQNLDYTGELII